MHKQEQGTVDTDSESYGERDLGYILYKRSPTSCKKKELLLSVSALSEEEKSNFTVHVVFMEKVGCVGVHLTTQEGSEL